MKPVETPSFEPRILFRRSAWFALALVLGSASVFAQDSFTNGLVAYYPFNGNANDASGNGGDGAVIGYDSKYSYDRFGGPNSLYLNTTSNPTATSDGTHVVVPRSASLDFNGDFSLSVWVNIAHGSGYYAHNLISNGPDTNGANLRIVADADLVGRDYLQFVADHNFGDIHAFVQPLRDTWWQAVVVRSGTNVSLFRNGALLTNAPLTATLTNSNEIWLGQHLVPGLPATVGSYPMVGGIDDVRIYRRALSTQEVRQLYQYQSNPLPYLTIAIKTIRLSIFVELGKTNQLESSTNFVNWTPYGPPFTATNSVVYQDVDVWESQQFFRVRWLIP